MKQQLTCIFLVLLTVGSYATDLNQKTHDKQQIIKDIRKKNENFYNLLESQSNYVVDEVLNILKSLEDAARQDLTELNQSWNKQKVILEAMLEQSIIAHRKQTIQCSKLDTQKITIEREISVRRDEIHINEIQIEKNKAAIILLTKQRCESNTAYINHIISHKDALSLFKILRDAIEQYRPGTFIEMIQLEKVTDTLGDYLNHYASQHAHQFKQLFAQIKQIGYSHGSGRRQTPTHHKKYRKKVSHHSYQDFKAREIVKGINDYASKYEKQEITVRTDFGNKHIDNKKGQIKLDDLDQNTVRSLANIKGQLIKILDILIANEIKEQQTDEIEEYESNVAAAKLISLYKLEIRKLTIRNRVLVRQITLYTVRLTKKISQIKICKSELEILLDAKTRAQTNLVDARERYQKKHNILLQEIALFNKLYIFYKNRVYNVATEADKARIQDYVDNKNFKNSESYTDKQTYKFKPLRNHVSSSITDEANKQVSSSEDDSISDNNSYKVSTTSSNTVTQDDSSQSSSSSSSSSSYTSPIKQSSSSSSSSTSSQNSQNSQNSYGKVASNVKKVKDVIPSTSDNYKAQSKVEYRTVTIKTKQTKQILSSVKCAKAPEWSTVNINCGAGSTIGKLLFASYGLPDTSVCGKYSTTGRCHAKSSFGIVEKSCLNKQSCSISATNSVFSDPCYGKGKTLAIQYQCLTTVVEDVISYKQVPVQYQVRPVKKRQTQQILSSVKCAKAPEWSNVNINCGAGSTIGKLLFASYGLPDTSVCGKYSTIGKCHAKSSFGIVEKNCLNKQSCSVSATNSVFNDPCYGKGKTLAVQYQCFSTVVEESTTFQRVAVVQQTKYVKKTRSKFALSEVKCARASEWKTVKINCGAGNTIGKILFASYGLPDTSVCGKYSTIGRCHAKSSFGVVEKKCLNQKSCSVSATNSVFSDPCHGQGKVLAIQYQCLVPVQEEYIVKETVLVPFDEVYPNN